MSVKGQLLRLLEFNRDEYLSGESLAKSLNVSRNAIWKGIESLRAEGYGIDALTNRGYRLISRSSQLSDAGIAAHVKNPDLFHFDVRTTVTSTNSLLRELAASNLPEGYVIAAEEQSAGKGRMGRSFHSPACHGIYFSVLLRPSPDSTDTGLITSAAAVATAEAIEELTGIHVGIKWVNDLFLGDKKVCGILTEATYDMESGAIDNAVLGIGVNVSKPAEGYPKEVDLVITSILENQSEIDGIRCRLIAAILDNFWLYYQDISARRFLPAYKSRSILLGRDILVLSGDAITPAHALEIDEDCRLVIKCENGEIATLNSGEVSIKI
ncbi:MAG: biotin--[acetyl-CoA-carboxylase] ligase [Oscillospiraceae bacterium]|nr:biotin--[acetyl-CoA-carboxylase] ligase [Oscillospiraceae bacterium]